MFIYVNNINLEEMGDSNLDSYHHGIDLKKWRLNRGLTIKELSQKTGIRIQDLERIEYGLSKGTPNQWIKLIDGLNIPVDQ